MSPLSPTGPKTGPEAENTSQVVGFGVLVQLPGAKVQDAIGEVGSAVASGWDAKGSGERQFLWILMV